MTAAALVSLRGGARHLGVSVEAIRRGIAARRITAIVVAGRPRLDLAQLEQEWRANVTDRQLRARPDVPSSGRTIKQARRARRPGKVRTSPLVEATARERSAKAKLAELEYERKAGELVPAAEVEARWVGMITRSRTKLLGLPSKAKQSLPHLTTADLKTLDRIVREALEELADEPTPTPRGRRMSGAGCPPSTVTE